MSLNPFASVTDYSSMLNKIAVFTFGCSVAAVILLRIEIPWIDDALKPLSFPIPVAGVNVPLGTILPAFIIALFSRMLRLHDRLSDFLQMRRRFDVAHILLPLAVATGTKMQIPQIKKLSSNRDDLMAKIFYAYASGTTEKAKIDTHYIVMALDQWSWVWVLVEANAVMITTAGILLLAGKGGPAAIILFAVLALLGVLQVLRAQCANHSLAEIERILTVEGAPANISKEFRAL